MYAEVSWAGRELEIWKQRDVWGEWGVKQGIGAEESLCCARSDQTLCVGCGGGRKEGGVWRRRQVWEVEAAARRRCLWCHWRGKLRRRRSGRERKRVGFGSEWKGVEKARELGLCLDRAGEIRTQGGAQPLAKPESIFFTLPFFCCSFEKSNFGLPVLPSGTTS